MTHLEVITNCINEMARINIPAGLIEQVGIPVYNVRQTLIELANEIIEQANKAEAANKPETKDNPEDDIQIGIGSSETMPNQNGSDAK